MVRLLVTSVEDGEASLPAVSETKSSLSKIGGGGPIRKVKGIVPRLLVPSWMERTASKLFPTVPATENWKLFVAATPLVSKAP